MSNRNESKKPVMPTAAEDASIQAGIAAKYGTDALPLDLVFHGGSGSTDDEISIHVETVDERERDHHQEEAVKSPANVGHFTAGRW